MRFNGTYLKGYIIEGLPFEVFKRKQKLFYLTEEEMKMLENEYNMVKYTFENADLLSIPRYRDIGVNTGALPIVSDFHKSAFEESAFEESTIEESAIEEVISQEVSSSDSISHGMKISSAFNGIDKEAQRKKAEEIMKKSAATMKTRHVQQRRDDGFEQSSVTSYIDDPERESVDRLLDPDYEVIYHFNEPIEEIDKLYPVALKLVDFNGHRIDTLDNEYHQYSVEDSESTINSDPEYTPMDQNPQSYIGDTNITHEVERVQFFKNTFPRWNNRRVNYIKDQEFAIKPEHIDIFSKWIHSDNMILYERINVSIYTLDFYSSRDREYDLYDPNVALELKNDDLYDPSTPLELKNDDEKTDKISSLINNLPKNVTDGISKELLNTLVNSITNQMKKNENSSSDTCSSNPRSFVSEISDYEAYAKDPDGIEIFDNYDLIEFLMAIDIYHDNPNIEKYTRMVINLVTFLFHPRTVTNIGHRVKVIKDYISFKLSTDVFFNFEITKDSPIYIKYRRMGLRPPLKRSYTYDPNNKAEFNILRFKRASAPTEKELALLEENKVFSIYAFFYTKRYAEYLHSANQFTNFTRNAKIYIDIMHFKYIIETLKLWKKHNISLGFNVMDRNVPLMQRSRIGLDRRRLIF